MVDAHHRAGLARADGAFDRAGRFVHVEILAAGELRLLAFQVAAQGAFFQAQAQAQGAAAVGLGRQPLAPLLRRYDPVGGVALDRVEGADAERVRQQRRSRRHHRPGIGYARLDRLHDEVDTAVRQRTRRVALELCHRHADVERAASGGRARLHLPVDELDAGIDGRPVDLRRQRLQPGDHGRFVDLDDRLDVGRAGERADRRRHATRRPAIGIGGPGGRVGIQAEADQRRIDREDTLAIAQGDAAGPARAQGIGRLRH